MSNSFDVDFTRPVDVICMGRVAVDLYSEQIGSSLEDTLTFRKYLGGCAGNIAVGCARLGLHSAMLSCVGNDAMGLFLEKELERERVNISQLKKTNQHLTGLVLLGVSPPDHFPLIFYRQNCADMQLSCKDVDKHFFSLAKSLLITGTGLSSASMRQTTHHAIEVAKSVKTKIIFDLDYRPVLWGLTDVGDGESRYKKSQDVSRYYDAILNQCDLIVGTEEEVLLAGNADSILDALKSIRSKTKAPIILKRGAAGCQVFLNDLSSPIQSRPFKVTILNVLGAGDAFMSGFLRGLLRGEEWKVCAKYGNACGAIVVTRHGCAPAMPTMTEMNQLIDAEREEYARLSCE